MPFKTTNVRPAVNAPVTVKFSGLMVLQPGPNETCEIGIHRHNREHMNQVLLIVNKPELPLSVVPLLLGPLTAPFEIKLRSTDSEVVLDPDPDFGDFKIYERDPFDNTLPTSDQYDHRWALNLRAGSADARLNDGARPVVTLKTGTLYTSNLSNAALNPKLQVPGSPDKSLNHFAGDLAASITPPNNAEVLLEWKDLGDRRFITLPRLGDPARTSYTVCFMNEPPNYGSESPEELPLYYKVLEKADGKEVPANERCKLKLPDETRSDEVPCMPVLLNP